METSGTFSPSREQAGMVKSKNSFFISSMLTSVALTG
jgi:hypothetical protein